MSDQEPCPWCGAGGSVYDPLCQSCGKLKRPPSDEDRNPPGTRRERPLERVLKQVEREDDAYRAWQRANEVPSVYSGRPKNTDIEELRDTLRAIRERTRRADIKGSCSIGVSSVDRLDAVLATAEEAAARNALGYATVSGERDRLASFPRWIVDEAARVGGHECMYSSEARAFLASLTEGKEYG